MNEEPIRPVIPVAAIAFNESLKIARQRAGNIIANKIDEAIKSGYQKTEIVKSNYTFSRFFKDHFSLLEENGYHVFESSMFITIYFYDPAKKRLNKCELSLSDEKS
jgi:hypothetical protein